MTIYIYGFTNILNGETVLHEVSHHDEQIFHKEIIKPLLDPDSRLDWNLDRTCVKMYKKIVKPGYIYNTKKEILCYSFFIKKLGEEECHAIEINTVSDIEEVKEQEETIFKIELGETEVEEEVVELPPLLNMRNLRAKRRDRKIARKKRSLKKT